MATSIVITLIICITAVACLLIVRSIMNVPLSDREFETMQSYIQGSSGKHIHIHS